MAERFPHQFPLKYATPEQRARWQARADRDGRSLSDWIRRTLDREAAVDEASEIAGMSVMIGMPGVPPPITMAASGGVIGEPVEPPEAPRHLSVVPLRPEQIAQAELDVKISEIPLVLSELGEDDGAVEEVVEFLETEVAREREVRPDPKPSGGKPRRGRR